MPSSTSRQRQQGIGTDLADATLGVVGLGRVGSLMPPVARASGMDVVAWSPHLDDTRAASAGARQVGRQELFAEADFVTLHLGQAGRPVRVLSPARCSPHPFGIALNPSRTDAGVAPSRR